MGLFKRHRPADADVDGGDATASAHAPDADDVVEVAVLELWRAELAVESLRDAGIHAAMLDGHGRRPSWAMESSVELIAHEPRMMGAPTARVLVHKRDAGRALQLLSRL